MMPLLDLILTVFAAVLLLPVAVFAVECAAALFPARKQADTARPDSATAHLPISPSPHLPIPSSLHLLIPTARPRTAVLVPAHNEAAGIAATLRSIAAQLRDGDRLLVVADNCTDATASIARAAVGVESRELRVESREQVERLRGAAVEVVERRDPERRGKGYALDFGVTALAADPPEVVVFVDADCRLEPGALAALVAQAAATGRPAQARYLLAAPPNPTPPSRSAARTSALAFLVKNFVRPAGLDRLGLPCLLTGAGMAFPWDVIRSADLATDHLTEDMQLGIDLALAGRAPRFCPTAAVTGRLPDASRAAAGQRRRWEHGHLKTLFTQVPRLLGRAITGAPRAVKARSPASRRSRASGWSYRRDALALALELCVPPLSLLVLLLVAATAGSAVATYFAASWLPTFLLAGGLLAVTLATFAVWTKFARRTLPLTSLLAAPLYVLWKVPLYVAYLVRPQKEWVRTARNRSAT